MHQKLYEAAKIKAAQDAEDAIQARKVKPGVTGMNRESIHFLIQERLTRRAQEEGERLAQEEWRQNQAGPSQIPVAAQGMEQPLAPMGAAPSAAHAPDLQTAPAQPATVSPQEAPAAGASIPGKGMAFKRPFSLFGDDENAIENAAREDAWRIVQAEMEAVAADDTPPGYNKILWKASKEVAEKKRKEKRAATDEWLKTYFEQRQAEQLQTGKHEEDTTPFTSIQPETQTQMEALPQKAHILDMAGMGDYRLRVSNPDQVSEEPEGSQNKMALLLGSLKNALQGEGSLKDLAETLLTAFGKRREAAEALETEENNADAQVDGVNLSSGVVQIQRPTNARLLAHAGTSDVSFGHNSTAQIRSLPMEGAGGSNVEYRTEASDRSFTDQGAHGVLLGKGNTSQIKNANDHLTAPVFPGIPTRVEYQYVPPYPTPKPPEVIEKDKEVAAALAGSAPYEKTYVAPQKRYTARLGSVEVVKDAEGNDEYEVRLWVIKGVDYPGGGQDQGYRGVVWGQGRGKTVTEAITMAGATDLASRTYNNGEDIKRSAKSKASDVKELLDKDASEENYRLALTWFDDLFDPEGFGGSMPNLPIAIYRRAKAAEKSNNMEALIGNLDLLYSIILNDSTIMQVHVIEGHLNVRSNPWKSERTEPVNIVGELQDGTLVETQINYNDRSWKKIRSLTPTLAPIKDDWDGYASSNFLIDYTLPEFEQSQ